MFIREGEGKFLGALGFPPVSESGSARATLLRGNLLINSQLVSAARRLINGRPPLARWRHAYSRARTTSLPLPSFSPCLYPGFKLVCMRARRSSHFENCNLFRPVRKWRFAGMSGPSVLLSGSWKMFAIFAGPRNEMYSCVTHRFLYRREYFCRRIIDSHSYSHLRHLIWRRVGSH